LKEPGIDLRQSNADRKARRVRGNIGKCPHSAASELLQDVFGREKNPTRLVYGVASLPLGTPVELEVIFEVAG